jgi:O-methyltransferase involved in polyketide biosynthesis
MAKEKVQFEDRVANTGLYVLLCKVRVMLFPDNYIRKPASKYQERKISRPQSLFLKDDIMIKMVGALVADYPEEFRELEIKYFNDALLYHYFKEKKVAENTGSGIMKKEVLLQVASREKFFRMQASALLKEAKIKQLLILGSGLDTFSARKVHYTTEHGVKFFEVDRQEPLTLKQDLLAKLGIAANATYIATNYLDPNFFSKLTEQNFSKLSTLIVWGGNTMYLTKEQVEKVMTSLKQYFQETPFYLTFDFLYPDAADLDLAKKTDQKHNGQLLATAIEGYRRIFNSDYSFTGFTSEEVGLLTQNLGYTLWRSCTAANYLKETGIEQEPAYCADSYSYVTLQNKI